MTIETPPLFLQGGTYPARLDRFQIAANHTEGVQKPTHCKVTQRGAGANFTVDIAVGTFWIDGDDQTNQGTYQGRITATENVTVGAAPGGSNQRYDLVTLRVNDPNAGGNTGNTVTAVVVAGTPSTSPAVPSLPASSLPLAVIGPITSSTSSITNSLINDTWTATGPTFAASCRLLSGDVAPTGERRMMYAAATRVNGWLYCDGSAVSRSTYADLFAMLGTVYGAGDGSTTFNLPDERGRVPVPYHASNFPTVGSAGGEINHTLTTAEMPSHNHGGATGGQSASHYHDYSGTTTIESTGHTHAPASGGWFLTGTSGNAQFVNPGAQPAGWNPISTDNTTGLESANHTHNFGGSTSNGSVDHTHAISSQGSGGAHNNMPPYLVVAGAIIKT